MVLGVAASGRILGVRQKIMKTLLTSVLAVALLQVLSCKERHNDRTYNTSSESTRLLKIYVALNKYEFSHGEFPASLAVLVTENSLNSEDILIRREDGSLQSPEYYPHAKDITDELLEFDFSGDGSGGIVVFVDGSVKLNRHNKAKTGQ